MTNEIQYRIMVKEEVISLAQAMKLKGYRLVQMHCTTLKDIAMPYEINYSYAKELELCNFRLVVGGQETLPSISDIYPAAFLYENEIHDLFGLTVENMSIDYKGKLYTTSVPTPFNNIASSEGGNGNG